MTWASKTRAMYQTMLNREPFAVEYWRTLASFRGWVEARARPAQTISEAYWKCAYCRRLVQFPNLSLDHVEPIAFGGNSRWLNLQLCCDECNQIKDTLPDECMKALREFIDSIPDEKPPSGKGQTQREAFIWRLRRPKFGRVKR